VGITTTDWNIWITADKTDTAYAVARYVPQPNVKREIIFNEEFLRKITDGGGRWPAYCVAAHELGHLFRLHLENRAIKVHDAELEADYYCGFVLGKMGSDYDQAIAAIQWIPPSPNYPTRDERVAQIGRGWTEATGQLTLDHESRPLGQSPEPPTTDLVKATRVSSQFAVRPNRDILGHDIAVTRGRIPGPVSRASISISVQSSATIARHARPSVLTVGTGTVFSKTKLPRRSLIRDQRAA
jgi:hypothetical protein